MLLLCDEVGVVFTDRLVADTEEGPMAVSAGNIVSLATKPIQYGRILHFGIDKVRAHARLIELWRTRSCPSDLEWSTSIEALSDRTLGAEYKFQMHR